MKLLQKTQTNGLTDFQKTHNQACKSLFIATQHLKRLTNVLNDVRTVMPNETEANVKEQLKYVSSEAARYVIKLNLLCEQMHNEIADKEIHAN